MQTIKLYRYIRNDGGVTNSTVKPECEHSVRYRLIADDGMMLTNGEVITPCVDVDSPDGWTEIAVAGAQYYLGEQTAVELEKKYSEKPEYDPETQYVTDHWEQDGQYAVQRWTVHDIPVEDTMEDRP